MKNKSNHAKNAKEFLEQRYEIDPISKCWNWTGEILKGYGNSATCGKRWGDRRAHRLSYRTFVLNGKELNPGEVIRHLCNNKRCINPGHLVPGSSLENSDDWKKEKYEINVEFDVIREDFESFLVNMQDKHLVDQSKCLKMLMYCINKVKRIG